MYHFLDQQIQTLGIEQKWIRHELQGEVHEPKKLPDYPVGIPVPETVEITVTICDEKKTIKASTNDTILQSLEKMVLLLLHAVVQENVAGVILSS